MSDYFQLAPPEAVIANTCDNCGYYSAKVIAGDESSGKCFRDHKKSGDKVWYVQSWMVCPSWTRGDDED